MGLGEGLALKYAGKGVRPCPLEHRAAPHGSAFHQCRPSPQVTLALTGRNKALLEAVGKACEARCAWTPVGYRVQSLRARLSQSINAVSRPSPGAQGSGCDPRQHRCH